MFERSREMIESVLEKMLFASRWLLALSDRISGESKAAKAAAAEAPAKGNP